MDCEHPPGGSLLSNRLSCGESNTVKPHPRMVSVLPRLGLAPPCGHEARCGVVSQSTSGFSLLIADDAANFGEPEFLQRHVAFVVRSPRAGSTSLVNEIQPPVWSIDSEMPLADPSTVGQLYAKSMARTSFTFVMFYVAGSMALMLGIVAIILACQ